MPKGLLDNSTYWWNPSDYSFDWQGLNGSQPFNSYFPDVEEPYWKTAGLVRSKVDGSLLPLPPTVPYSELTNTFTSNLDKENLTGLEAIYGKQWAPWITGGKLALDAFNIVKGLADWRNAGRQYKLGEKMLNFKVNEANRNIENQAQSMNNIYKAGASTAAAAGGARFKNGKIVGASDATKGLYMNRYENRKINGSPITF